jgi:hypothetical protein
MSSLLPGVGSASGWPTLPRVLASLQSAVSARLGLRAPRLVQLLQTLLQGHEAWFQKQRCSDIFAAELKVDALWRAAKPLSGAFGDGYCLVVYDVSTGVHSTRAKPRSW